MVTWCFATSTCHASSTLNQDTNSPLDPERAPSPITKRILSFLLAISSQGVPLTDPITTWLRDPSPIRFESLLDFAQGSTASLKTTVLGSHETIILDLRLFPSPTKGTKSSLFRKSCGGGGGGQVAVGSEIRTLRLSVDPLAGSPPVMTKTRLRKMFITTMYNPC